MQDILAHVRCEGAAEPSEERPAKLEGVISTQAHVVDYASKSRSPGTVADALKGIALV